MSKYKVKYGEKANTNAINWLLENTCLRDCLTSDTLTENEKDSIFRALMHFHFNATREPMEPYSKLFSIRFDDEKDYLAFLLRFG